MQQKKIGDVLYVFDTTPYEITEDTDAKVIKVQGEYLEGFAELNESLEDKLSPINYKVFTVTAQEWGAYVNGPEIAVYDYVSYGPEGQEWGEGTVTTTGKVVNGLFEVKVLTGNEQFVNMLLYIQPDAEPDGTTKYPLYDEDGKPIGIDVTITED